MVGALAGADFFGGAMKRALALLLALALSGCGGGLSQIENPQLLQSAPIGAALYNLVTTTGTRNFVVPLSNTTAQIAIVAGATPTFTLSVNGSALINGTGVFPIGSTGDYTGLSLNGGAAVETVSTVTPMSGITKVGQSGTLYTSTWASAGVQFATETVTYSVATNSIVDVSFCETIALTANPNPYGISTSTSQACFFVNSSGTVDAIEMQIPVNGVTVPFLQK